MGSDGVARPGGTDGESVTLSTGHRVDLPLVTEGTMTGAVFSAPREDVRELLPDGLSPVRATPTRAAVAFLCAEYHRVGRRGQFEPYDEFGIVLPAVHGSTTTVPFASMLTRGATGYVRYLPVTTEPARALGAEVWGYPKEVADVTHEDEGSTRRTTVTVDGEHLITVTVDRPRTVGRTDSAVNYTTMKGTLLCERLEFDGRMGMWPYTGTASYTLGDHPRAERLREMDLGDRALLRFAAEGETVVHEGRPVGSL